ncbi:MAG TPA: hypothetical protein VIF81_01175 [Pyrinomonadaceae bacterium]|jgi:hypothetical protein
MKWLSDSYSLACYDQAFFNVSHLTVNVIFAKYSIKFPLCIINFALAHAMM